MCRELPSIADKLTRIDLCRPWKSLELFQALHEYWDGSQRLVQVKWSPRKSTTLYLKETKWTAEFRRGKVWRHHGIKGVSLPNWRRDTTLQEEPEPSKGHEGELFLWGLYTDHSRLHALHQMLPGQAVSSSVLQIVGIAYGSTAVNWGSFVREVFKEHFHRNTRMKKLSGIVELDESLFGKRTKYHRGSPHGGMKVQNL